MSGAKFWPRGGLAGGGLERQEALVGLDAAAPFVRRALGGLRMRRVPEIRFAADKTLEHASRIEELLRDVMPGEGEEEEGDGEDR